MKFGCGKWGRLVKLVCNRRWSDRAVATWKILGVSAVLT